MGSRVDENLHPGLRKSLKNQTVFLDITKHISTEIKLNGTVMQQIKHNWKEINELECRLEHRVHNTALSDNEIEINIKGYIRSNKKVLLSGSRSRRKGHKKEFPSNEENLVRIFDLDHEVVQAVRSSVRMNPDVYKSQWKSKTWVKATRKKNFLQKNKSQIICKITHSARRLEGKIITCTEGKKTEKSSCGLV